MSTLKLYSYTEVKESWGAIPFKTFIEFSHIPEKEVGGEVVRGWIGAHLSR